MGILKLYNTLGRKIEDFTPIHKGHVGIYSCGPTVYSRAHLGNLRAYIFVDILKRTLRADGYAVKHVMNITDVGHLTSDADEGEDKIERAASSEHRSAREIADEYTNIFKNDIKVLNILEPDQWINATDTIQEQIALVKLLEQKGYTYNINDGVYFDTLKLADYGKLTGGISVDDIKAGARVKANPQKRHATDFALWKFSPKDSKRQMEWSSPWGTGFPGWHLECSVMSCMGLGQPFDIHTGGVDHIRVHHTNEIAQSEAAYGEPLANYWLHNEFLVEKEGERMAKSKGNALTIATLEEKGIDPLAFRYLCLGTHYRHPLNFSWEALEGAQNALRKLRNAFFLLKDEESSAEPNYVQQFNDALNNDLNTPKALAIVWELVEDKNVHDGQKRATLINFDTVLGTKLLEWVAVHDVVLEMLVREREQARKQKNWKRADELRAQIEASGEYTLEDASDGPRLIRLK